MKKIGDRPDKRIDRILFYYKYLPIFLSGLSPNFFLRGLRDSVVELTIH